MPNLSGHIYTDYAGQAVAMCIWCHQLIFKSNEDLDWLHLATEKRWCGEEEFSA